MGRARVGAVAWCRPVHPPSASPAACGCGHYAAAPTPYAAPLRAVVRAHLRLQILFLDGELVAVCADVGHVGPRLHQRKGAWG